ncbi:FGGY-family carbohydrate kinase [Pseudomonadota bacterium]
MINTADSYAAIIDIGKTHVKLCVLDRDYNLQYSNHTKNAVNNDTVYPSACIETIWNWLVETIQDCSKEFNIVSLTVTTHGATAALIDRNKDGDGLVLPILDYEYAQAYTESEGYFEIRPEFEETFSPNLPAGLNLGRQIYWLKQNFPNEFAQTTDILMYPQYWAWRFTQKRYSEITSLGCHTDLWSIKADKFSSLVESLECKNLFPEVKPAWYDCGRVLPELAAKLGLNENCHFYSGLHDSNASFLRYRLSHKDEPFTVISTGTWTIMMASKVPINSLDAKKDMLANIDVFGDPIACGRFMGGREFEAICTKAGSWLSEQFSEEDLQQIIDKQVFALPDFSEGSGPFGGQKGKFVGHVDEISGIALATIYCALMIDYQLSMLGSKGNVYIEGAFLKNPLLCGVVSQLRAEQNVYLSLDSTGTVQGAAYLTDWEHVKGQIKTSKSSKTQLNGLLKYQYLWLEEIAKSNKHS